MTDDTTTDGDQRDIVERVTDFTVSARNDGNMIIRHKTDLDASEALEEVAELIDNAGHHSLGYIRVDSSIRYVEVGDDDE